MKKDFIYMLLVLYVMAFSLQSCKEDEIENAVFSLSVDGEEITNLTFGYGQTFVMAVLSSNTGWSLSSDQSWCTLSNVSSVPTEEQYIKISVERNTTDVSRTATIFIHQF